MFWIQALILFSLLFVPIAATAFNVSLRPAEVSQGDAFLVVVDPLGKQEQDSLPSGRFAGQETEILFTKTQSGVYAGLSSVGRGLAPGRYQVEIELNGHKKSANLTVLKSLFPVDRLTLPKESVTLNPGNAARAKRESTRLGQIWGIRSPAYWKGDFIIPLNGKLGTKFGLRRIINGLEKNPHNGIDIKGARGKPVHAVNAGVVVLAADLFFGGNTIILDHGQGLYSFYMHLDGFAVEPGGNVNKESTIGYVGSTGRATGPHLHIGTKLRGINVNPLSLIKLELDDLW